MAALITACAPGPIDHGDDNQRDRHAERHGIGVTAQALTGPITIDTRTSLAVTDAAIVDNFTLRATLDQLAAQSGDAALTGADLFVRLWDVQNQAAAGAATGAHCDDVTDASGQATLNSFPYACPRAEGAEASSSALVDDYIAIGLFNRFDLAPEDGANCGEYRIIFAKNPQGFRRNLIIFEAVLPNPNPQFGLHGCRPVAEFWRTLSDTADIDVRATALEDFYFDGLPGFMPVIHKDHYGNAAANPRRGQIRTNQFLQFPWLLREFTLDSVCDASGCTLAFSPTTVKDNPFGPLFSPNSSHALTSAFQNDFFPAQVEALADGDINRFRYAFANDRFNAGDSASMAPTDNQYSSQFSANSTLATAIQNQLTAIGSALSPANIVARAEALSCAGCHQLSNNKNLGGGLTWPSSLGFVHVSEFPETLPDGSQRFRISPALSNVFLPHRKQIFESFLNTCAHDMCEPGAPLTGEVCEDCVQTICAADPYCCNTMWDSVCIGKVSSVCGSAQCTPTTCSHDACTIGVPLPANGCGSCVQSVCAADSYCCDTWWDEVCVDAADSMCNDVTCN